MASMKQICLIVIFILAVAAIIPAVSARSGNITIPLEVRNSANVLQTSKQVGVNVTFFDQLTGGNPHFAHGTILATTDANGRIFPQFDVSALNGNATYFIEISIDNVTATPRVLLSPALYAENAERFANQTRGLLLPTNFSGPVNITSSVNIGEELFVIANKTGTKLMQVVTGSIGAAAFNFIGDTFNITLLNMTGQSGVGAFQLRDPSGRIIFQINASGLHRTPYTQIALGPLNISSGEPLYLKGNFTHVGGLVVNETGGINATSVGFGILPAGVLPTPTSTTLGGIKSLASAATKFLTSIGTDGVPVAAQPAFTDISGSVADTQLPNPSATTLGGIRSYAAVANQWINTISTSGVPSSTQPAFTDISGSVAATQLPNPAAGAHGGVRALTCEGTNKLTGIGTNGTPSCGADASGAAANATNFTYYKITGNGKFTWTNLPGYAMVYVVVVGAGGGGSGGRSAAVGAARPGGTGGGGGAVVYGMFHTANLPPTVSVTVGVAGAGGAAGANGGNGGTSDFGGYLAAHGGGGGVAPTSTTATAGGGGGGMGGNASTSTGGAPSAASGAKGIAGQGTAGGALATAGNAAEWGGASGAGGPATGAGLAGGQAIHGGGGGGSGGGCTTGNVNSTGGVGGAFGYNTGGGGGAGIGTSGNGQADQQNASVGKSINNNTVNDNGAFAGEGGGGGGSWCGASAVGGTGGTGGWPGGGGGGGGAGVTGGSGGAGNNGSVMVWTW